MVIKTSGIVKGIAAERITILYELAKEAHKTDPKLSSDYVKLIKRISRHYKIRLDKDIKRHICKKCGSLLVPGGNLSIRLVSNRRVLAFKCLDCGSETHVHY